jgi:hypothetical protein
MNVSGLGPKTRQAIFDVIDDRRLGCLSCFSPPAGSVKNRVECTCFREEIINCPTS